LQALQAQWDAHRQRLEARLEALKAEAVAAWQQAQKDTSQASARQLELEEQVRYLQAMSAQQAKELTKKADMEARLKASMQQLNDLHRYKRQSDARPSAGTQTDGNGQWLSEQDWNDWKLMKGVYWQSLGLAPAHKSLVDGGVNAAEFPVPKQNDPIATLPVNHPDNHGLPSDPDPDSDPVPHTHPKPDFKPVCKVGVKFSRRPVKLPPRS